MKVLEHIMILIVFLSELVGQNDTGIALSSNRDVLYRNRMEAGMSYTYLKVPFYGLFKHNELFNLNGNNIYFKYERNFRKNSRFY